jgi:sugar phosphate isomerase/epimerase
MRRRPLAEAMDVIAAAGFKKVDLVGVEPHFPPSPDDAAVQQLEGEVRRTGVKVANLGTYYGRPLPGTPEDEQAELAAARRGMDAAVRLGARSLRLMPGKDRSHETGFAVVPFFRQVAQEAEQRGLYLGIETHGGLSSDAPAMVELCRQVGSRHFGVLFDPSNCMGAGVDYKQAWAIFHDHVVHVHLKDGRRNAEGKWERCHLGEGEVDAAWLLRELDRVGYGGDIALEYEVTEIEPPETGLVRWRQYCEQL